MKTNALPLYLFTHTGLDAMKRFIDKNTLFAFDLDGTLAPIASKPDGIGIPATVGKEIEQLAAWTPVAVLTGRSRADALKYLGFSPLKIIGNHGAEGLAGWEERTKEFVDIARTWYKQLESLPVFDHSGGLVIENKGPTLSVHYRHSPDTQKAEKMITDAVSRLTPVPRQVGGKYILNLIPQEAPDKGVALRVLLQETGCTKAFFAGDDLTDEDVFVLNDKRIFSVLVGMNPQSHARYYLHSQQEMVRLLEEINSTLGVKKIKTHG